MQMKKILIGLIFLSNGMYVLRNPVLAISRHILCFYCIVAIYRTEHVDRLRL